MNLEINGILCLVPRSLLIKLIDRLAALMRARCAVCMGIESYIYIERAAHSAMLYVFHNIIFRWWVLFTCQLCYPRLDLQYRYGLYLTLYICIYGGFERAAAHTRVCFVANAYKYMYMTMTKRACIYMFDTYVSVCVFRKRVYTYCHNFCVSRYFFYFYFYTIIFFARSASLFTLYIHSSYYFYARATQKPIFATDRNSLYICALQSRGIFLFVKPINNFMKIHINRECWRRAKHTRKLKTARGISTNSFASILEILHVYLLFN